jgi:hypothetical protein
MLLIIVISFSCSKDEVIEGTDLYGKWNWVSSKSGLYGTVLSPQTEGYTMSMEFKATRKVEFKKNDTTTAEKPFSIAHDAKISVLPIIRIGDDLTWYYSIKNDTLFLNNVCSTCYNEKYLRVK